MLSFATLGAGECRLGVFWSRDGRLGRVRSAFWWLRWEDHYVLGRWSRGPWVGLKFGNERTMAFCLLCLFGACA